MNDKLELEFRATTNSDSDDKIDRSGNWPVKKPKYCYFECSSVSQYSVKRGEVTSFEKETHLCFGVVKGSYWGSHLSSQVQRVFSHVNGEKRFVSPCAKNDWEFSCIKSWFRKDRKHTCMMACTSEPRSHVWKT